LCIPMAEMQHVVAAGRPHAVGNSGVALRCFAEGLAPSFTASQSKRVVERVTDLVAHDTHHPVRIAALDLPNHLALEPHETRMREIKRNGDPGDSIWREPFDGQPDVRAQAQITAVELAIGVTNRALDR